jgi:hypothetical protein
VWEKTRKRRSKRRQQKLLGRSFPRGPSLSPLSFSLRSPAATSPSLSPAWAAPAQLLPRSVQSAQRTQPLPRSAHERIAPSLADEPDPPVIALLPHPRSRNGRAAARPRSPALPRRNHTPRSLALPFLFPYATPWTHLIPPAPPQNPSCARCLASARSRAPAAAGTPLHCTLAPTGPRRSFVRTPGTSPRPPSSTPAYTAVGILRRPATARPSSRRWRSRDRRDTPPPEPQAPLERRRDHHPELDADPALPRVRLIPASVSHLPTYTSPPHLPSPLR